MWWKEKSVTDQNIQDWGKRREEPISVLNSANKGNEIQTREITCNNV